MKTGDGYPIVPVEKLRWRLDPAELPFETTDALEPLKEIVGQERGVEAFRFGMAMDKPGYNVFVTGRPGSGRLDVVRKLLREMSGEDKAPDDFCYVNNFKTPEAPILLRFSAGWGSAFKKDMHDLIETLRREVPEIFESQEYISRKNAIMEAYNKRSREFFKSLDQKVKDKGFALVTVEAGPVERPELMPIVDGQPIPMLNLEELVNKGRFPKDEFEEIKSRYAGLKKDLDQIFFEIKELQKEVREKGEQVDRLMFKSTANQHMTSLFEKYRDEAVHKYLHSVLENLSENLSIFRTQAQPHIPGLPPGITLFPIGDPFLPYQVNLLVDNSDQKSPPVIIESYPTYRNLFGSIERVVDNRGVWRSDFSKIKAGSFLKANGGYLVLNMPDVLIEPGVWPALKRALKTKKMEIQTYDPFYWFTSTGLKPEPIEIDVKVVVLSDAGIYQLLRYYDEDVPKIFKVRADFDQSMDRDENAVNNFAQFIRMKTEEEGLMPFDRSGVAAVVEHGVRMTGRQEKLSTSFPVIADLLREADYWARRKGSDVVTETHVDLAVKSRIRRSNMIEEKIQEMIDRGTLMIDTDGAVIGQVNGLSIYAIGDYMFGRPTRITANTAMGREGIISIDRETELAGPIHNKGIYILSGYLRRKYAQNKPLSVNASITFEQSYTGLEGDSASSGEIYTILSSLAGIPLKQGIAVTGSMNQKGEVQAIGGVNEKIEGFYDCCVHSGLTDRQGVIIPEANVKDLMLRKDVVDAVSSGSFHVWAVKTIDQGMEILTDMQAGERMEDGTFPEGTINFLVDSKLADLAEGLHKFGKEEEKGEED